MFMKEVLMKELTMKELEKISAAVAVLEVLVVGVVATRHHHHPVVVVVARRNILGIELKIICLLKIRNLAIVVI